jgi:hypothetical protein
LYIITVDGLSEAERENLLETADHDVVELKTLNGLSFFGLQPHLKPKEITTSSNPFSVQSRNRQNNANGLYKFLGYGLSFGHTTNSNQWESFGNE